MKFAVWTLSYIIAITKYNQNKFNPTNVLLLLLPNESLHAKYFVIIVHLILFRFRSICFEAKA